MSRGSHLARCNIAAKLLTLIAPLLVLAASTIPAPIAVSPSQYWEGNDGLWSTFTLQIGTPEQYIRVLISTAGNQAWAILPEGCTNSYLPNCADLRGSTFNPNTSSTWILNNYYDLHIESNLGIVENGEFGFERLGMGWKGSNGPILEHQIVAGISTNDFWLGYLGLNPRPTNFTNFRDPQQSFMQTLKNKSMIPSLSWSYTAGAAYRFNKVLGSLTLGGFDLSKAGPKNMSFPFASDDSRDLTVGLQGVSASVEGVEHALLPQGVYSFIDSTIPQIWLPIAACQQFEQLFGLTIDPDTGIYLINDTLHQKLLKQNATFTFTLGINPEGGQSLEIVLPYASFDLFVDYPTVQNRTRYFPLMRATNETQYTLGRLFLQEAYLTVDYERSTFYLSQTSFTQNASQHIIAIPSINSTSSESVDSSQGLKIHALPVGTIVGISIACILAGIAFMAYTLILFRRSSRKKKTSETSPEIEYAGKPELDAGAGRIVSEMFSKLPEQGVPQEIAQGMATSDGIR